MGWIGRAVAGGIAGGVIGGMNGGWAGAGVGAAAGVGIGSFGGAVTKRLAGGRTITGGMTSALGMAGDLGLRGTSRMGNRSIFNAAMGMDRGLTRAASFLGTNQVAVNKWGGRALMGAGIASSAYIGSSIVNSNRGY